MMLRRRMLVLLLCSCAVAPAFAAQNAADARLKEIEDYVAKAVRDWNVPGLALAVVKDDAVILARGYGVRRLGDATPVDERTLFAVASNSKAFTATALGILVDEGKIKWDEPVTKYLPWFQLHDAYATRELTVRDLLSHRSGLATFGGDLLWYETTYNRAEILRRIRHLRPASSFRSRYGYQNIMFLAAGEIIPAVTGKSWDEFLKERFFVPLGMTATNTSVRQHKPGDNVATPHNEKDGHLRLLRAGNVDNAGGAAAINSSAAEMAQWLRLQLGRGTYQNKTIFSRAVSRETWSPQTIIPFGEQSEKLNPTRHFYTYGLGWFLSDYHGRKVVGHGGGLDGMISQVGMLPEENLGVVVLTNSETPLASLLTNKIFDVFLGVPARDWSAEYLALSKQVKQASAQAAAQTEAARVRDTKPSLALEKYAQRFAGELYGEAQVAMENGQLVLRLGPAPNFVGDLQHWHYDTFRLRWRPSVSYGFGPGLVSFTLDAKGEIEQMKIDVPNPDFDFTELELRRVPEAKK